MLLPNVIRAQVVLPSVTALPKDVVVNTFHFNTANATPPTSLDYDAVNTKLAAFYNTGATPAEQIASFISPQIDRAPLAVKVRCYDLGQAEPRTPHLREFTLNASTENTPLPSEVALCLSYYGNANVRGQRGRVYLGPFNFRCLSAEANLPRVNSLLRAAVAREALALANTNNTLVRWVLNATLRSTSSRTVSDGPTSDTITETTTITEEPNQIYNVKAGWIDNEFDTQRRRGIKSDARTLWAVP